MTRRKDLTFEINLRWQANGRTQVAHSTLINLVVTVLEESLIARSRTMFHYKAVQHSASRCLTKAVPLNSAKCEQTACTGHACSFLPCSLWEMINDLLISEPYSSLLIVEECPAEAVCVSVPLASWFSDAMLLFCPCFVPFTLFFLCLSPFLSAYLPLRFIPFLPQGWCLPQLYVKKWGCCLHGETAESFSAAGPFINRVTNVLV